MYKFRVGDFLSRDSVNILRDTLMAHGYDDAWVVTSNQPLPLKDEMTPYFTMTLAGFEASLGNNTLYPDWINNQLFGDLDLQNPSEKEDFHSLYLKTSPKVLASRLFEEKSHRPMISHLDTLEDLEKFIAKHLFERAPFYLKAENQLITDNKSVEALVAKIENLFA